MLSIVPRSIVPRSHQVLPGRPKVPQGRPKVPPGRHKVPPGHPPGKVCHLYVVPGTSKRIEARIEAPKPKQPPKSSIQNYGWLLYTGDYRRERLGYIGGAHCPPNGTCGARWSQSRNSSLGSEWRKRARDTMSHSARNRESLPEPHQDGVASTCLDKTDSDCSLVDAIDPAVVWRHPPEPRSAICTHGARRLFLVTLFLVTTCP